MAKHILAILNQKGGVGKTTTTLNLGSYLAKAGKKVLIIDLDPQGNATSGLGLDKYHIEGSTYHVLLGEKTVGEVVRPTNVDNLFILPTEPQMAAVEVELVGHMAREQKLKSMLGGLEYDVVLIDCPPSLGLLTVNALTAATHVLIPVFLIFFPTRKSSLRSIRITTITRTTLTTRRSTRRSRTRTTTSQERSTSRHHNTQTSKR
jgi:chromosome partitioning protein